MRVIRGSDAGCRPVRRESPWRGGWGRWIRTTASRSRAARPTTRRYPSEKPLRPPLSFRRRACPFRHSGEEPAPYSIRGRNPDPTQPMPRMYAPDAWETGRSQTHTSSNVAGAGLPRAEHSTRSGANTASIGEMKRPLRGPYRVVLCDVGETLVHYKRSFSTTISAEAERLGARVALSEVRRIADEEYDRAIRDPVARGSSADASRSQGILAGHVRRHGPTPGSQ